MRQQVITQDAAGTSEWLPVDNRRHGNDFNASLAVTLETASTLTYDVDLTYDRNSVVRWQKVTLSRTTTTVTATLVDHGLITGDNVEIFDSNYTNHNSEPNFEGRFDVTVVDKDTFTYTVADTGQTSGIARLVSFRVVKHPTLQGDTTAQVGIQNEPVSAIRLNVTAFTAGSATLTVLQQG